MPAVDEISFFTCQCVRRPPAPPPTLLSSAKDVRYILAFGLQRSVPSSFGDQAYFGKFRGTGYSGKDDEFLFLFGGNKRSQV